jgi:hypothetical protein
MVYTIFSRKFQMLSPLGPVFPVKSTDHEVISNFYRNLSTFSRRPPPITTIMGKFSEIFEGLDTLRKGEGRGTNIVIEFQRLTFPYSQPLMTLLSLPLRLHMRM